MHNIDERMSIVMKRANKLKQLQKQRSSHILSICSAVACFALIVGMAFAMPNIMSQIAVTEYTDIIGFAGIFSSGNAMGYLVIALLSFMLGICLTILCIYLHKRSVEDKDND